MAGNDRIEGPFDRPPVTFMGVDEPPPSVTGGDAAVGCVLQLLVAVLVGTIVGWSLITLTVDDPESRAILFDDEVVPTSTSSLITSTTSPASPTTTAPPTTTTVPPVEQYAFTITYSGSCSGDAQGSLTVLNGTTVELSFGPAGAGQTVATTTVEPPGRSFTFSNLGGSEFTMSGRFEGASVSGFGSFSDLGPGCSFTMTGSRV